MAARTIPLFAAATSRFCDRRSFHLRLRRRIYEREGYLSNASGALHTGAYARDKRRVASAGAVRAHLLHAEAVSF